MLFLSPKESEDRLITIPEESILNITIKKSQKSFKVQIQTDKKIYQGLLNNKIGFENFISQIKENISKKILCGYEEEIEMRKKTLARLLTFLMVLGMFPAIGLADENVPTYDFCDMPNNWSTAALEKAVANGLLMGRTVGDKILIEADAPLKRAEMAAVVNRAFGAVKQTDLRNVTDVESTAWYVNDMSESIMMGTFVRDKEMRPESNITRQEAFVVLARAFKISSATAENKALNGFSDKADVAAWAKDELNAMTEAGYVNGYNGKLSPNANISRAEFAVVMDNLAKQYIDADGEITSVTSFGNVIIRAAGVSLKNLAIKGDLIIADGVGDGNVTLDNVTVEGRTVVRGGGENSFIIKGGSKLGRVIVCKVDGKVRIAVEEPAAVEVIYVDDGSDDVFVEGIIGTLEVAGDGITATAIKGIISNAIVSGDNSAIILKTSVVLKRGRISGAGSKIIVEKGATANNIIIDGAGAKVEGEGIVTTPSTGGGGSSPAAVSVVNIATDIDVIDGVENDAVVKVTLTTTTGGAEIYYTTDGSEPAVSSTKYTTPFNVQTDNKAGETVTVKVIGIKSGSSNSAVVEKKIVFKTAGLYVADISITNNAGKITYYEGEILDLTGLRVKLTYSDDSEENVELPDFAAKGITTDPVNGSALTTADHNGKPISVSCNGFSDSGDSLSVYPSQFAGGNGTIANPYKVENADQLNKVRYHLDKHFIQTADIDMADYLGADGEGYNAGAGWDPIGTFVSGGTGSPFTGSYNGNGKTISNLIINRPDKDMVGLFEYSSGIIENVSLLAVDIIGKGYVGGLVGNQISGEISDCSVSGSVKGIESSVGGLAGQSNNVEEIIACHSAAYVEGYNDVGGLIGQNEYSNIEKCYASGNVKGNSSTTGGLVAVNYNSVISNSYATGSVVGTHDEVGGLVGWNTYSARIVDSYATGRVTGGGEAIGGLVGQNKASAKVDNCYATGKVTGGTKVGGLIGETIEGATTTDSYWDTQTSGLTVSAGGIGYSTPAMIKDTNSVEIYIDWDFTDTWTMEEGVSYPYLKWQGNENIPLPPTGNAELMGYWKFDEGTGLQAEDSSGNNYHGTIIGARWTEDRNEEPGKALAFGANQWVDIPDSNLKAEAMSFSAWIFIKDKNPDVAPIFSAEKGTGATGFAYRLQVTKDLYLRFETIAPYSVANARVSTSDDPLDLNKWYHVAATYDGFKTRIYLDGILIKEDDYASYRAMNTAADIPVGIGHLPGWTVQWFKGTIDDARIYSGVLSSGEIETLAELR